MAKKTDNAATAVQTEPVVQSPAPSEPTPAPTPEPAPAPVTYVVVSERFLNLREGPGLDYPIMGKLPADTTVTDAAMPPEYAIRGWTMVDTTIGRGWVKNEFIKEV